MGLFRLLPSCFFGPSGHAASPRSRRDEAQRPSSPSASASQRQLVPCPAPPSHDPLAPCMASSRGAASAAAAAAADFQSLALAAVSAADFTCRTSMQSDPRRFSLQSVISELQADMKLESRRISLAFHPTPTSTTLSRGVSSACRVGSNSSSEPGGGEWRPRTQRMSTDMGPDAFSRSRAHHRHSIEPQRSGLQSHRHSVETSRSGHKSHRHSVETSRSGRQSIRHSNETSRSGQHSHRHSIETSRSGQQSHRHSIETSRSGQQSHRHSNETARSGQQSSRQSGETPRSVLPQGQQHRQSIDRSCVHVHGGAAAAVGTARKPGARNVSFGIPAVEPAATSAPQAPALAAAASVPAPVVARAEEAPRPKLRVMGLMAAPKALPFKGGRSEGAGGSSGSGGGGDPAEAAAAAAVAMAHLSSFNQQQEQGHVAGGSLGGSALAGNSGVVEPGEAEGGSASEVSAGRLLRSQFSKSSRALDPCAASDGADVAARLLQRSRSHTTPRRPASSRHGHGHEHHGGAATPRRASLLSRGSEGYPAAATPAQPLQPLSQPQQQLV